MKLNPVNLLSLLLSCLVFTSCGSYRNLEMAGINNFSLQPKSLAQSQVRADVLVYNPNKRQIYVSHVTAALWVNDRELTSFASDSNFQIPAMDTLRYPVQISISNMSLLGGALDFLGSGQKKYRIQGKAKAGTRMFKTTMSFDETGDLKF